MLSEHAKRMKLNLTEITINQDLNVREELDNETIERYAESWEQLPPIVVFNIGDNSYLLADGFHRVKAAERLGRKEIEVELRQGTKQDAEEYAALANLRHGKPLTRAERRKAVERMLKLHPERANNWIAEDMGVSENTVKKYREESGSQIAKLDYLIGKDGKKYPREVPQPQKNEQLSDEQVEKQPQETKVKPSLNSTEHPQESETSEVEELEPTGEIPQFISKEEALPDEVEYLDAEEAAMDTIESQPEEIPETRYGDNERDTLGNPQGWDTFIEHFRWVEDYSFLLAANTNIDFIRRMRRIFELFVQKLEVLLEDLART